jgi:hypothetical protein
MNHMPNHATGDMTRAALALLDDLRVSYRLDLNYYIDEAVIGDLYQRMEEVRTRNALPHIRLSAVEYFG